MIDTIEKKYFRIWCLVLKTKHIYLKCLPVLNNLSVYGAGGKLGSFYNVICSIDNLWI